MAGLYPKFEEKLVNGQNNTLSMFLDDTACPFHNAFQGIWSKLQFLKKFWQLSIWK